MIQDIKPHQLDSSFFAATVIKDHDYVFYFKENTLLLKQDGEALVIPEKKNLKGCSSDGIFLFSLNNIRCFLVWDCAEQNNIQFLYHKITFPHSIPHKEIDWAAGVAFHLRNWYKQNRFCGSCGARNVQRDDERAMLCPSCQTTVYPKISPAIIVAIICNDRILLARNASFPVDRFSLVAGYVDIGETIEYAVAREVKEEVGIEIKKIRYHSSQPWPFSGSMMIGFTAEADEDQMIQVDGCEIVEAAWFGRDDLPGHPTDRSIAGEIIGKFRNGVL